MAMMQAMTIAREWSQKALAFDPGKRVGAVITFSGAGVPVAFGHNAPFDVAGYKEPFSLHAEVSAIDNLAKNYSYLLKLNTGVTLDIWVYREMADGRPANSKPCKHCMFDIQRVKTIRNVHYIDEHGNMRTLRLW